MALDARPATPTFAELMDPAVRADPYPVYAGMREHRVLVTDGVHVVTRHADVFELLRDRRVLSDMRKSAAGDMVKDRKAPPTFLTLDPPDHTRLRGPVVREFRPRLVERLRPGVEELTTQLIDASAAARRIDLVEAVAHAVPVTVICDLLGVPRGDVPRFARWSAAIAKSLDGRGMSPTEQLEANDAIGEMAAYGGELLAAHAAAPGEDLLSLLLAGRELAPQDLVVTSVLLLVAGHETTVNLIANAMLALLRDPALLAEVREDLALVPPVVEETLRHDPPVQFRNRTCEQDIALGEDVIPAGASIVLALAGAHRDPARFPDPDRFDPHRDTTGHLGFGGGPHFCVGAMLARMEAAIVVRELVRRLDGVRLAADPPPYRPGAALRGPERLDVLVDRVRP